MMSRSSRNYRIGLFRETLFDLAERINNNKFLADKFFYLGVRFTPKHNYNKALRYATYCVERASGKNYKRPSIDHEQDWNKSHSYILEANFYSSVVKFLSVKS